VREKIQRKERLKDKCEIERKETKYVGETEYLIEKEKETKKENRQRERKYKGRKNQLVVHGLPDR
jgi:hypothetical protein